MSKITFYSITAVVLAGMIVFFAVQLYPSAQRTCTPVFTWDCDMTAQVACEGDDYTATALYSACIQQKCVSSWKLICGIVNGSREWNLTCTDEWGDGCDQT